MTRGPKQEQNFWFPLRITALSWMTNPIAKWLYGSSPPIARGWVTRGHPHPIFEDLQRSPPSPNSICKGVGDIESNVQPDLLRLPFTFWRKPGRDTGVSVWIHCNATPKKGTNKNTPTSPFECPSSFMVLIRFRFLSPRHHFNRPLGIKWSYQPTSPTAQG